MEKRITTSIFIKPSLWKQAKIYAINHDMDLADFVEKVISEKLGVKLE